MPVNAVYEELFQALGISMAAGVCEGAADKLVYANEALLALPGFDAGLGEKALRSWFNEGALHGLSGKEETCQGAAFFRHNLGNGYLCQWWEKEEVRFFTIQPIAARDCLEAREIENILDSIHDGIWIIDGNGITLRINRAMERIAGIKSGEVVGRHVSEPLREGRFKTCVTLRALEARRPITLFDDYSNGKRCLNTSIPVFDDAGNVWRVIAAIRDMTELEDLRKRLSHLEVEKMAYRQRIEGLESQSHNGLLGESPLLHEVLQDIAKAAQTDAVTLILGETGTGKSLAARTIHEMSARVQKPFVAVNCGAIPPALMESELFGYEKGAFTGANKNGKPGMLEMAAGGTILLDEIGELSLSMQARLLHMLDGQPIYRVGGTRPLKVDARIIAATNRPLEKMVGDGLFREDLFYRLRVLCMRMPPLRERKADILILARYFLLKKGRETGVVKKLDAQAERLFIKYNWPGNVRELQSVIQSLATLCENEIITSGDLPSYMRERSESSREPVSRPRFLEEAVAEVERSMLAEALAETGSTYKAARRLGISQSSVVRKARKYGLHGRLPRETDAFGRKDKEAEDGNQLAGNIY